MVQKWIIEFVINQVIAYVMRWLDSNQPTQKLRGKPTPIIKSKSGVRAKYAPPDLTPGHWNKAEGRWN